MMQRRNGDPLRNLTNLNTYNLTPPSPSLHGVSFFVLFKLHTVHTITPACAHEIPSSSAAVSICLSAPRLPSSGSFASTWLAPADRDAGAGRDTRGDTTPRR